MFFLSSYDHFQRKLIIIAKSQGFFPWLFSLSWEQRKLGEVVKEVTRNDPTSDAPIMMITANNGFIEQSERYAFNNAGESLKKYILLEKGELAYNHGASKLRPYGSCFALTTVENARIPFVYHCFSVENHDPEFMSIELNGADVENQLRRIVSSGARMDGLLNISFEEYTSVEVLLPERAEQERISSFFRSLDNLITLHQRKYDKLMNIKKSMLEKMFPRDGANVPEIRFAGFTDAWEQRKLGEIAEIIGGGTPDTNNAAYWDGDIDWYAPAEMEGKRYATGSTRRITELGLQHSSARMLPAGRTVLFTSRAGIGKMAILQHPAATNQGFQSLVLRDGYDPCFVYSAGSIIKEKAEGIASGSTFLEVSGKMLSGIEIAIPSMDEQGAIADFFRSLDDLITLHQREGNLREKKSLNFAWEQRKLGEIVDVRSGRDYKHLSEGTIPVYGTGGYMLSVNEALSYDEDAIGIGRKGTIDKPYILKAPFWTVDTLFYAVPSKNVDLDFAFCIFQNVDWKKKDESTGVPSLSKTAINSIDVITPPFKEQQEIGGFFRSLDDLITLHQREHKSNFRRKTNVKQSTRDRPFLLLLCSVDKGLQRGSGP